MTDFDQYMLAFGIFITSAFVSRQIAANGAKKLTPEKKAQLMDLFGGKNFLNYLFLVVVVFGYYAVIRLTDLDSTVALIAYIFALLGYVVFSNLTLYRKLKSNDFPPDYIKTYLISSTVRFVGIFLFLGFFLLDI